MHKLSHVEAQRVIGVLGETLERLDVLACVPEVADPGVFRVLEENLSAPVLSVLENQFQLEEAVMVEMEMRNNKASVANIAKKLRGNTRALCRELRESPDAVHLLRDFEELQEAKEAEETKLYADDEPGATRGVGTGERKNAARQLVSALDGLREVMYRVLTTTVEDETSQREMLQSIASREKEAHEDMETLEHQLGIARRNRSRTVNELDSKLSKLRAELRDVKEMAAAEEANLTKEIERQTDLANEEHAKQMETLGKRRDELQEALDKMADEMGTTETQLTKKKTKFEGEVNDLVARYDEGMLSKQREIDDLRARYDKERKQLSDLEDHFEKVDDENARIAKEEEAWAAFVEEKKAKERVFDDAAVGVQKLYRGWQGRVAFEAVAKKSKKGKKGKK